MKRLALVAIWFVAACASPINPTPSTVVPTASSLTPRVQPTLASPPPSVQPTLIPPCGRQGSAAFPGVVDAPPHGWSAQGEIATLPGFATTYGRVYGPDGVAVPPSEGPSRLALYETLPANDAYFKSRIEQSRKHHGKPIAVTVCDEATEVWLTESTGELIVGWTDRDKSDVLVANTADFTVRQLVDTAERVYDCCG